MLLKHPTNKEHKWLGSWWSSLAFGSSRGFSQGQGVGGWKSVGPRQGERLLSQFLFQGFITRHWLWFSSLHLEQVHCVQDFFFFGHSGRIASQLWTIWSLRGMPNPNCCGMCCAVEEIANHLFIHCSITVVVWEYMISHLNVCWAQPRTVKGLLESWSV